MRNSLPPVAWILLLSVSATAQTAKPQQGKLAIVKTVAVKSEPVRTFAEPLQCDSRGNTYMLHRSSRGAPPYEVHEFSSQGKPVAVFSTGTVPGLQAHQATYFSVADDGTVYQLLYLGDRNRYVALFTPDGSFKAKILLQTGFILTPQQVVPFPSGNILVAGMKEEYGPDGHYTNMVPFTGIFSREGTLLKTVVLPDDTEIGQRSEAGDIDTVDAAYPHHIKGIVSGRAMAASNGNVYLMRRLSPRTVFYAISPAGDVVKTFPVENADDTDSVVLAAHISEDRLAVQFVNFGMKQGGLRSRFTT